ncbi:MAG TPA: NERD domain-containing protein, partial [Flavobacterium sp.]|nr:NERD domain-containing protein [Flavobacterium sp.]
MAKARLYPDVDIIKKRKPEPTEGERKLLSFLLNNFNEEYEIFYQPFLNGDLPDIILMRKDGGLIVIEVKDWDLHNYNV